MGETVLRCLSAIGVLAVVMVAGTLRAQQTPVAIASCGGCHRAQTIHQAETPMARALLLTTSNPTLKAHSDLVLQNGGYTYRIQTRGGQSAYSVSDGTRTVSVPLRWTMGENMQTWVFERKGRYYESRVSYYPIINGLEITVGQENLRTQTLEDALGRELNHGEVRNCFGCHSSGTVRDGEVDFVELQPGVTCEHCHAGALEHQVDALEGIYDSAPRDLKKFSAEQVSSFCGQCHRTWATVIRLGIRGERNVRFQPYRLENSKCFNGRDRRISCVGCHDPHQPLVRDDASYDGKCVACHASQGQHNDGKVCPVAKSGCTGCHMEKVKVSSPAGLLIFTDHDIRVNRPGDPYPN